MKTTTIIEDLYSANEWAWQRIFLLCDGLSDEQLDAPREMGLGSLRATLFHILTAEQIWLERWRPASRGVPFRWTPPEPRLLRSLPVCSGSLTSGNA
jgi:uncharacterized damage-inducible protein DinB